MHRRAYLAGVTSAVAATAGCVGLLDEDGGTDDDRNTDGTDPGDEPLVGRLVDGRVARVDNRDATLAGIFNVRLLGDPEGADVLYANGAYGSDFVEGDRLYVWDQSDQPASQVNLGESPPESGQAEPLEERPVVVRFEVPGDRTYDVVAMA